jgi:hypothetical protein
MGALWNRINLYIIYLMLIHGRMIVNDAAMGISEEQTVAYFKVLWVLPSQREILSLFSGGQRPERTQNHN